MKNSKKVVITFVAILTAVVGIAVAIGAYIKKKAADISEKLDFDGDLYCEDDDCLDEEDDEPEVEETTEEKMEEDKVSE